VWSTHMHTLNVFFYHENLGRPIRSVVQDTILKIVYNNTWHGNIYLFIYYWWLFSGSHCVTEVLRQAYIWQVSLEKHLDTVFWRYCRNYYFQDTFSDYLYLLSSRYFKISCSTLHQMRLQHGMHGLYIIAGPCCGLFSDVRWCSYMIETPLE